MTQMITSTSNHHSDRLKKDAKSATMNSEDALDLMHDHRSNMYHSSLYRHQLQSRQQHQRSATLATTNLITSSHSLGSPYRSPLSLTGAADPARPHSTPSCYSYSNNKYHYDDDGDKPTGDFSSLCETTDDVSQSASHRRLSAIANDDSFDTMLSYLRKNDELAQQMDEIEKLENLSFLRVMYLGVSSTEEKHLFLKKLSDGLSESLFRQTPAPPPQPISTTKSASNSNITITDTDNTINDNTNAAPLSYGFRERKYHLLPLHLFLARSALDDDYYDDHAAMFENNGVSIVEADFSTDSNMSNPRKHSPDLILHYIYTQYQQYISPSTLNSILNPPPHLVNQRFDGHVFSEGAPNGIDLCVYFYHDAQKMADVTQDMDLLWKINTLGVPVLPIMSMSNQTTTSSHWKSATPSSPFLAANEALSPADGDRYYGPISADDGDGEFETDDNHENDDDIGYESTAYVKQRPIDVRRNELAYIFSQWRIKMMDISNLDIIGQPSFQQKGNARNTSTQQDMEIEQRLGQAWATSGMTSPTPYQILTLFQFLAMDRWAVSKLLRTIQDRADERCYGGATNVKGLRSTTTLATNDEDIHISHDQTHSLSSTTESRQQRQQQQQGLISPSSYTENTLLSTTTIFQQDNKNHLMTTQEPLTRLLPKDKEKLVTIHLWLLYTLPLLVLLLFGIWVALTGLISSIMSALTLHQYSVSPWHASLIMVSHTSGKSMTLMVNVYDEQHQPRWAPEPPLLLTNLRLPLITTSDGPYSRTWKGETSITTTTPSSLAITYVAAPLLNKTQSLEGQYFYTIHLPPCLILDSDINYTVQVKPSKTLSGTVQGSPLQLPRYVLCDPTNTQHQEARSPAFVSTEDGDFMENGQDSRHLLEAWYHFKQYSRFYLMNSLKIVELIFTEGKEKD